jgi:hypothetical protein
MKRRAGFIVIGALILLCMPLFLHAKDSGVLLGLRSLAQNGTVYRTVWITSQNGEVELTAEGEDILVPRNSGFWKIGVTRRMDEQWQMDVVWAGPATEKPFIPHLEYDEGCEGSEWTTILFVGNNYVSFERESGGYCEGAAHPWAVNWLEVLPIDDIQAEGGCRALSECVGEGANTQLLIAAEQYRAELTEEEREMLEDQPTDCSWGLIRRRGQWVLRGRLRYSCEAYRGHYADFDIPLKPPATLVSHDELNPSWEKVVEKVPAAIDAFSSPGKDLLVVLTKDELTVHSVSGNDIGASVLTLTLNEEEAAVMIQWAQGTHVQRWTDDIGNYIGDN